MDFKNLTLCLYEMYAFVPVKKKHIILSNFILID